MEAEAQLSSSIHNFKRFHNYPFFTDKLAYIANNKNQNTAPAK